MNFGYIKISRKAYTSDPWWREPRTYSKWEAWEDCIQMAAFGPYSRRLGDYPVDLKRGEFVASLTFLSQRWRWSRSKVARWLADACLLDRLRLREGDKKRDTERDGKRDTRPRVYVLVNYDQYQDPPARSGTPNGTPSGTNDNAVKEITKNNPLAELVAQGLDRWKAEMGGPLPFGRVMKAWKPLVPDWPPTEILERWRIYFERNQRAEDRRYLSPEHFASRIALFGEPIEKEMTDDFGAMRLHRKNVASGEWEAVS